MDYAYPPDPQYHIGSMNLFGPGIPTGRSSILTRNIGVTGPTGMKSSTPGLSRTNQRFVYLGLGWYMNITGGAPKKMRIYPRLVPTGQYIIFAMRYPLGTSFSFVARVSWNEATNMVGSSAVRLALSLHKCR